jgi:hypothetical protein
MRAPGGVRGVRSGGELGAAQVSEPESFVDETGRKWVVKATADCPFCGLLYSVVQSGDNHSVLHGLPMCRKFEALEPLEYLIAARQARGIYLPEETS